MSIQSDYQVDVNLNLKSKQAFDQLQKQYDSIKAKIEKDMIQTRITADTKDLQKVLEDIAKLGPEQLQDVFFNIKGGTLGQQLKDLDTYVGQAGKDVAAKFREGIQEGMKDSYLGLDQMIEKYLGAGKRTTSGNIKQLLEKMTSEVSGPLDNSNYLNIVERAEKLEQLYKTISDIETSKPNIYKNMGTNKKQLGGFITEQYAQIGDLLTNKANVDAFKSQIMDTFSTLQQNIQNMFQAIFERRKIGFGAGDGKGYGTGDGTGSGNGAGGGNGAGSINKGTEAEIERITNEIKELNSQLEEAQKKLIELQNNVKMPGKVDFRQIIDKEYNSINWEASEAEIEKMQKKLLDLFATYKQIGGSITDFDEFLQEDFLAWQESLNYQGKAIKNFGVVDTKGIEQQTTVIDNLKNRLAELEEQKKKLLESPEPVGNGDGTGGATIEAKPDGSKFIEELQKQIEGQSVQVEVKPNADNFKAELESKVGALDIKVNPISQSDISKAMSGWNKGDLLLDDLYRQTRERFAVFNKDTGYISNTYLYDDIDTVEADLIQKVIEDAKEQATAMIHTHPTNVAAFSPEDISLAITALQDGIKQSYVMGLKEVTSIDLSSVSKEKLLQIEQIFKTKFDELSSNALEKLKSAGMNTELNRMAFENSDEYQNQIKEALNQTLQHLGLKVSDLIKTVPVDDFVKSLDSSPVMSDQMRDLNIQVTTDVNQIREQIKTALQDPFNYQVQNTTDIRNQIGQVLQNPFEITLDPSISLIDAIKQMLDSNSPFGIDINANSVQGASKPVGTSAPSNENPYQMIYDMMQADDWMRRKLINPELPTEDTEVLKLLKERMMMFNSKTGNHTNPFIFDKHASSWTGQLMRDQDGKYIQKGIYDTGFHSHPEVFAHMSIDNFDKKTKKYSGDLTAFLHQLKTAGIEKQIIAAQKDVQLFDAKGFFDEYINLFDTDVKKQDTLKKFNGIKQKKLTNFSKSITESMEIMDYVNKFGDGFTLNLDSITDNYNGNDRIGKALKNYTNKYKKNPSSLTKDFMDFAKHDVSLFGDMSFNTVLLDYLTDKISSQMGSKDFSAKDIRKDLSNVIDNNGTKLLFDNFYRVNNGQRIQDFTERKITEAAWKEMGVDWGKYTQYIPIEDFKKQFANAVTPNGGVDMSKLSSELFSADVNFENASQKLREAIASGEPYSATIEPDNSLLSSSIQSAIDNGQYSINSIDVSADLHEVIQNALDSGSYQIKIIPSQEVDTENVSLQLGDHDIQDGQTATAFQGEAQVVDQAISSEEQSLDRLKSKLVAEIPEAVDKKTQAFRSEQVEVDNLIDLEINKVKELAETLQNAFATSGNVQDFSALKDLIQAINDFSTGENISTNLETLSSAVQGLVDALKGASDISNASNQLSDLMQSMRVSKANVENMIDLATAIEMLVEQFRNLGKSAAMPNILQPINDILKNAESLKDLAKVLSSSAKERREASIQAGINPDVNETKANDAAEKQLDNLMKYYALQDEKNHRQANGKSGRASLSAIAKEEKLLRAINDYEAEIAKKKQNGISLTAKEVEALKKREELEKLVNDRRGQYEKEHADAVKKSLDMRRDSIKDSYEEIQGIFDNNLSISKEFFTPELDQKIAELKKKFQELRDIQLVDEEDISKAESLRSEISKAIYELQSDPSYRAANANARTALQAKAGKWLDKNTAAPESLRNQVGNLYSELSSDVPVTRLKEIATELNTIDAEAAKAGKTGKSFADMLGVSFKNLGRYLLSFASFYQVIGIFRQAIGIVKELDSALMEVRKVSSESLSSLKEWQQLTFSQANDLGGTAQQIQESTAAWLRLGKSFEEASEAAQASVKLLNVSEFTNIDDATTSLVSMRQAFKDLSYEDFIDKLNGVGDNFSSSTDQLAYGMQNVSSVLKVAGNDIDQSLALLTAANDITQDMSKASMGVRTVALRIAGTEDAKAELEELGEDTSDFIVQTQSKVDAKVRKYTATADNPNGISVLDDNGRLRSTYDILLDISKVYDQIVEKDNQFGTNTSNALLELLAGKTRSNILASILQNPTVLEEAYTQSQNSKGIGQKELDIYLDSIQAKITQLQNALQKLASVTINSDWIKAFVDLGSGAVKIFSVLTEKLGSINTIIAPLISAFLQRKGFGMLESSNGPGLISRLFGRIDKAKIAKELSPIQKEVQKFFNGIQFDKNDNFFAKMTGLGFTQEQLYKSDIFGPMLNGMKVAEAESLDMGEAINKINDLLGMTSEVASSTGELLSRLGGGLASIGKSLLSTLASIGKSLLSTGLTTVAITAITLLIGAAAKAVYDWATQSERAIEAGKKAREEAENLAKSQADVQKQTKELGKRYNELRKGVTYTEGKGYTNKNLSEDDFQEFLQVNKDIIALYPQLKAGTDAQGNAYVNLGDNASKATEELEKYLAIQERITNKKIGDTFDTQLAGVLADNATFAHNIDDANYDQTTQDLYKNGINKYVQETGERSRKIVLEQLGGVNEEILAQIEEALGDNLTEETRQWGESIDNSLDAQRLETIEISFDINPEEQDVARKIDEIIYGVDRELAETASNIEGTVYESNRRIKDNYESLRPAMIGAIKGTRTYQNMSDEIQKGIDEIYSNIDIYDAYNIFENIPDDEKKAKNINTFIDYLEDQYLYAIDSAINNAGDDIDPQEQAEKLNKLFSFDASNLNSMQAVNQIDAILSSIFGDDTELKQSIKVGLGIEYIDPDTGKPINKFVKQNHDLYDVLKDYGLSLSDISSGLTIGEKDTIQSAISSGEFNFTGGGLERLKEWLNKEYQPKLSGSLSDIFNDGSYKENAEEISSGLSTISSSLETLRTNGKLTAEEMMKLQESFPDMTEFTEEALSSRGVELLSKWIKELRKDYDTLSDEGKEQVDTYINNLTTSFSDAIATEEDAVKALYDSFINPTDTEREEQLHINRAESVIKGLKEKYGDELDWNIVWQLAVNDQLSGDLDEIYKNYDDRTVLWNLEVELPEELQNLQSQIDARSATRSAREAYNNKMIAEGRIPDISYLDSFITMDKEDIEAMRTQKSIAEGRFRSKAIARRFNPDSDDWMADAGLVQLHNDVRNYEQAWYDAQAKLVQDQIDRDEYNIKSLIGDYDKAGKEAEALQTEISHTKEVGLRVSKETYGALADSYRSDADIQRSAAREWLDIYNNKDKSQAERDYALDKYTQLSSAATSSDQSALEAERGWLTDELLEKQNAYNDLQTEASEIEQKITDDETKHRKVSSKRYDELIKNGEEQIANLKDQRKVLENLQAKTIIGTEKWREYQSQINDVDSSISSMENSQIGWYDSMTTAVSSNAQALASALDSAFSEINSETGLTRDTMNTLVEQFSDLENYDVSKIFYSTADGMKFNTDATRELIDAEYDLQVNNLRDAIAEETAIIEANKDSKDANSYATIQNAQANINAYNAELASLQALYDQQQESLSRYSAWETAKSTANAGDKYTNLQGSWKDIKEMFQNGLTGTDDFKSFVAYFDEWGMGTVDAYKRNKDMITRYLTEDGKGMKNFYDDLVSRGFGTKTGNIYSIGIEDTEAAAHAMGMSEEALKMFLDRGEDYGFRNTWVETVLDGELKLQDTTEQLIEEQERLQHMRANGATADEIKNQETLVSQLKDNMKNYIENTADVAGEDNTKTYAKTIEQLKAINELRGETFGAKVKMTDRELSAYNQQLDNAMQQTLGGYTSDQLQEFKIQYEAELDDDSKRIIDQMTELAKQREIIQKYTAEVEIKDESGQPITPEEFLSLTEEQQKETLEATYGVTIDETNFDLWKEHFQSQTLTAKVQTVVDSGTTSYKDLLNMDAEELTQTIGFNVDESNIDEVKAKIEEMSAVKVSLDETSLTSLTSVLSEAFVLAINTIQAGESVDEFVEETDDKTGTVQVDADTKEGENAVARFVNNIMAKHPAMRVLADPTVLIDSIQEVLNNREFNVNVKANVNAPAAVVKPGVAKKVGNVAVNGRNNGHAYANGKPGDLVGELGREIVVDPHTGRYYTVGDNGPEFTNIPDDAIVFNADQTDDLLKHGHTSTRGRALVTGNAFDSADSANEFVYNDPKNTFGKGVGDKATKDNTKATKDNTKASKEQKTALDKFNEWLGKWVDWIDNRIDTLSNRIERFEKTAEQAIGYVSKNNNIQEAMNTLSNLKTFQQGKLLTKDVTGTNGVTAQIATGTKNAKKGTLLGDTMRGAVRYQQQADKVMKKAVKSGLLSQKKANEIAKLIQTGEIDIRKYNEKVRAVISAYEDWFGKSQDLIDSTYELKQQFKDLEQTKLDNITERFETLVGLFEAANTASEATVDYYTTRGKAVNTSDRTEMTGQLGRQKNITTELGKELKAYQNEMKQAAKIFGKESNEYREAQTQYQEIAKALTESRKAELELIHAIEELRFTVRGYVIDRIEAFVNKLSGIAGLAEKRGTNPALGYKVTEDVYAEQTKYNNDLIEKYYEDLQDRRSEVARRMVEEGMEINSDEYQELYNKIVADEEALLKLYSANEDLKNSIRTLRWKEYKEFQETLDKIDADMKHIQSFIREGELLDEDGQFTARAFAQIALIGQQMDVAEKKIANARVAIEKLNAELANGTINQETFGEEFEQQLKIIQDAASEAYDDMQKLADMYIKQITEENSILQDLISKRKEALSAKKSYYDFDKQIREKNKDVNSLRAQVQALQNVSADSAKARRAQLQAQLAEAEQDLNDTRYDHQIEMQQQGYDKLSQDMQEALDNAIKLINGNIDTLNQTAGAMLKQLEENNVDELGIINGIVEGTGTKIHGETHQMLDETLTERQALSENAMNMANGISAIAMLLGQTPSEMANSLYEIVNQLGDNGTLSQAIKMFASENGIQIDGTSLEGIVSSITSPFDKGGEARQLFDDIYDSIAEGGSTVFSEASGMKGAINTMAGLLGKDTDSVYTRMQTIINDLGPNGTLSEALKQYIDQENIKLDERTSQMLDELVAPYDEGGQAQYLMTQIKDSLTGETGVLKLLSDLGVTKTTDEEGNPDWNINFDSIDWQPVTEAISNLDPVVNITLNSDNKDIKDKLDKIEEEVLSLKSPGGTNGETSKGNKPVADAGEIEKLEEQKRQNQEDIQNQITANLEELSKKDKDLEALQKKINELTTSHTMYNDKINAKKERLKEAKKNNEGTKKYEQIRQQISSLRTTRDAVAGEEAATVRAFNDLLAEINRDKTRIAQMEEELKALSSFSSGSKRISKKQLAWTNENINSLGAEMIVRKSDGAILTPLKANDAVIPANLADNLFKWGAISPDKFLSNPFLGKMGDIPQSATVNNQVDQQVQMHFDSLFTIQGNVDSDVMDRLEEFGKALTSNRNFQQNVVKFVTKDFVRESKKQGGFR